AKDVILMSYQELAKSMIDRLPEDKMIFVVNILENIGEMSGVDVYPESIPNSDTLEAIAELENGGGHLFTGTTDELFSELLKD
ncbi:MAG: hypothetical protein LUE27_10255, partial [Clostridia bacterium]|nr:hypothetical protein [Clostridia bacterium]